MNSESALRAHRGCSPFTPEELRRFSALLQEHRAQLEKTMGGLMDAARSTPGDASGGVSSVPGHLAELASETFEQEFSIDLARRTQTELEAIQAALERVDHRSYGLCTDCGAPIPAVRLEAMPMAELCIACKSQRERSNEAA